MKCVLYHRTIPVLQIELDDASGVIREIGDVYAREHLPLGVGFIQDRPDRSSLNAWWTDRSIPASRSGVREALETLGLANTKLLLTRCFGLSLSDQYWIKPEGTDVTWEQINFFENPFSDDIGDVLFGAKKRANALDFSSPDSTSDGNLKKRWKIIDGKRCLIKGGSSPFRQQPFNEVIAAEIAKRLHIPHNAYSVLWNEDYPYSVCKDFVTGTTELIPAWRIIQTKKKPNNQSVYQHFVNCASALGITDVIPFLDRMIVLDYIIANEDRHLNNFGAIRNAENLEWLGMAPIYDSGSSLGYDKLPIEIRKAMNATCKPFKNHHAEQLKLVSDFSWIDFNSLSDVRALITDTLSADNAKEFIDANRIQAIVYAVEVRIQHLKEAAALSPVPKKDTTADDVGTNVAADYNN